MSVLDTKRAAKMLGVHPVTLRNLAIEGKIPCRKVGREWRFHEDHLTDWLRGDNAKEGKGETEWQSTSAAMSGGFVSPRRTEQEYENLLGPSPGETRKNTNPAANRNSGASTSSATSRVGNGRTQ